MRPDNSRYLIQAARGRHEAALRRARTALNDLDNGSQPVTFRAVATTAGVSRAWLYRQPQLRAQIEQMRANAPAADPVVPAAQRATDQSRQQRIQALLADNTRLRDENTRLREHVAALLGERRAARASASQPVTPTLVSDMSPE